MKDFKLFEPFKPAGDQERAIDQLVEGIKKGYKYQTLLGATGTGKTFTIANVINKVKKPTLIMAPNKTLAAQLCSELRTFFPKNAVEYFISYYDYYQPEAYIPQRDLYIEKDASVNDEIDRYRHSATRSLLERDDVIVVASVSCIYSLGQPEEYKTNSFVIREGDKLSRDVFIDQLIYMLYERNDYEFKRNNFRVNINVVDFIPSFDEYAYRVRFNENSVKSITKLHPVSLEPVEKVESLWIFPASHFILRDEKLKRAIDSIKIELEERIKYFESLGKVVEARRIEQRTLYDIEMLQTIGYCKGVENYSRHFTFRKPGEPPITLLDYFPKDFLIILDESHLSVPQIRGMFRGDEARKKNLIDFGFRLPSAYDNRPLRFEEFIEKANQIIFMSATPASFEKENSSQIVEQIIRPTGILDPIVEVRDFENQVSDSINETRENAKKGFRTLITTLTKRLAEDLANYLVKEGIKAYYLHSEQDAIERLDVLHNLRLGKYDVVVGINLLREGLDLPEVTRVLILDADKEGFLRSSTSLIQTIGRAARNVESKVILYASKITESMKEAIDETNRRRRIQMEYNLKNNITPTSISKPILDIVDRDSKENSIEEELRYIISSNKNNLELTEKEIRTKMIEYAKEWKFEEAAKYRDLLKLLKNIFEDKEVDFVTGLEEKITRKRSKSKRSCPKGQRSS
ncbi:Excinuclease ABC subunit B [Thermodesulfobium acidiphilum]|uniref:UvrABC system protein B n=1 Tax=Thermodesulfobium acidiphilum TaxID=1794699 RepID=A0A2R4W142_THEAF|nr:excinuclease ABC subunit UvrB [Thermodesulfobium acidiphilum]AWB10410.1 Excinuclease ABC subunit B [Thermodesulfobium acidiphilum]